MLKNEWIFRDRRSRLLMDHIMFTARWPDNQGRVDLSWPLVISEQPYNARYILLIHSAVRNTIRNIEYRTWIQGPDSPESVS